MSATFNFTKEQLAVEQKIIAYGSNHGYGSSEIEYAVRVAYIESRFDPSAQNSSTTASGLFQYTDSTWSTYNADLGAKNDANNQIAAMYREITKYSSWFSDPAQNQNIPSSMTRNEYLYLKHHDGVGATPSISSPAISIWRTTDYVPRVSNGHMSFYAGGAHYDGYYDLVWNDNMYGFATPERTPNVTVIYTNSNEFYG
ncbi:transglycosylase SLT domain-containing protein [Duganella levis]|uniref:Transglycosylase SLT domain-containing protein n=1 Tax=Duganella levis TaxID=2692169 RepID=A0ABW9W841_9BURK|nr:transglycosylase SLT domain-containing protein [Duganella levis]MYN30109.1 transglycosylase SLT domain-containing protein [Duganella levis]